MMTSRLTEPHPLSEQPVAVDPERLDERLALIIVIIIKILAVLVEPTAARHQLAAAHRASLKVATGVVRSTTDDPAVSAPVTAHSPAALAAERNKVEAPPIPMECVDGARGAIVISRLHQVQTAITPRSADRGCRPATAARNGNGLLDSAGDRGACSSPLSIGGSEGDSGPEAQHALPKP